MVQVLSRVVQVAAIVVVVALPRASTQVQAPSFKLSFLGHEIGEEKVTVETGAFGRRITSDFAFTDRGTRVALAATLELAPDGKPVKLVSKGRTYRLFSTDIEVVREGDRVRVRDEAKPEEIIELRGRPFFPVDAYAPIAVQEELIKFWMANGRPKEIVAPPAGVLTVSSRGVAQGVERLAIEGVVWGTEGAVVDVNSRRLIGLTTWAGNLPFEAAADGHQSRIPEFIRQSAIDRISELTATTRVIAPIAAGAFAVTGARIVEGTETAPIDDGTIIVRNGRIAAIGPSASTRIPAGMRRIDAKGKTIIPGLWDMHAHASQVDWAFPYLAGGVTTIRDMGGENEFLVPFRDAIASGKALGPRMLLAGLVDAPGPGAFGAVWASTPEEGRAIVRRLKADRFEQVKIYTGLSAEIVKAMGDEAHKLDMTMTGHAPRGAREAVENGFDQIAHGSLPGPAGSPATNELIAFYKQHGTALDPTSSWGELSGRPAAIPIDAFIPGVLRLPRALSRQILTLAGGTGEPAAYQTRQLQSLGMLNEARKAGIPVVAGTDKGIPGFSLQREIELYVKGGMTPREAIQAASIVPARVMKLDKDTGTLETGKRADFVILDGNPLDDIVNIRTASRVVAAGKLYDSAALWRAAGFKPQ
jgi:imidazolonepropionase-like amidohydrolase